jgi:transmembrane 9 superfamily protein 2/4
MKKAEKESFIRAIDDEYSVHWSIDNLPAGMSSVNEKGEPVFLRGFPVGFHTKSGTKKQVKHYLNNHVRIIIEYHDDFEEDYSYGKTETSTKIVGFRVEPMSIKHDYDPNLSGKKTKLTTCNRNSEQSKDTRNFQSVDGVGSVVFTYDVFWEKSEVEWTQRWDKYLYSNDISDKVHWFSISNSIMIVLFLTVMIAMILLRALRKDIAKYNDSASLEEAKEESGWKLVHGDVFRPPSASPMLFSVFVGTGVQLGMMGVATLTFAVLGLLSPANRGSLTTALIMLFVFMGSFAGYYSSVTYKMFRGTDWKQNTLLTAFLFPGTVFSVFFILNLALWAEGSSGALPFGTFFTLFFLWFCVSVPLVFIGSFFGYKRETNPYPVRTNQIPR